MSTMRHYRNHLVTLAFAAGATLFSAAANAHMTVTSKTGYAKAYYRLDMAVPHGCGGADTYRVEIQLPPSIKKIRPVLSAFGYATIEKDPATGNATKIIWEKPADQLLDSDSHAYSLSFRTKLPDTPFKKLYFPSIQYCRDKDGVESTREWVSTTGGHSHRATAKALPAPSLFIYPKRNKGWNKFIAPDHLHNMHIFKDAEIVWKGKEAYSPNAHIKALIEKDAEASLLSEIHPGEEIWVKY